MELTLLGMARGYLPYSLDQRFLLPPDIRSWLPEGHLALFVVDVVSELDLSAIHAAHERKDVRGRAGFDPRMMLGLLVYAYCTGRRSSRVIERSTYEDVAFRVISGDQHPDHDVIASFRRAHLPALANLFSQVLKLCQKAGLVKLGHISIDGSKFKANASKHKAMSYERMCETEKRLEREVAELLAVAEQADRDEDAAYGSGRRGDELPGELARRESRLAKIREAKAALEAEARAKAQAEADAKREAERASKKDDPSPPPADPGGASSAGSDATPSPNAQRNFTDPESRIMPDGANKGSFVQAYNAQIAVDSEAQIIVAAIVTQSPNDVRQLVPMAEEIVANVGALARTISADAGYFSKENVEQSIFEATMLLVPPSRQRRGEPLPSGCDSPTASAAERMRHKLASTEGRALYKRRKAIVEPVFGQLKQARGVRQFLMRGLAAARGEFSFVALTHNLLKLFRSGARPLALVAG